MSPPVTRGLLKQGARLLREGDLEQARLLLAPFEAPDVVPPQGAKARDFWRDAAGALRDAGLAQASVTAWQRAASAGLSSLVAGSQSAVAWMVVGQFAPALETLAGLSAESPRNATVGNLHAIALLECGHAQQALDEWRRSSRFSPQKDCPLSTHPVYLSLGAAAVERFLASRRRCVASGTAGETSSVSAGSQLPGLAPGRTHGRRMNRIERAMDMARFDEALAWIDAERALQGGAPGDPLSLLRAMALGERGDWAGARNEVASVLTRDPEGDTPSVRAIMAWCLIYSGAPRTALALLERIEPAGPDDFFANHFRACAWLALNDRVRAHHAFRRAFTHYFFDSYHLLVAPDWRRMAHIVLSQRTPPKSGTPTL